MRIFIVEDERQIAAFLERGLKEEGYAIDVVYNGNDAVDWATAVEYDGIVLDVMLPGRDGFSVCRELRSRGNKTPILMLTARDTVDDRVTGWIPVRMIILSNPLRSKNWWRVCGRSRAARAIHAR